MNLFVTSINPVACAQALDDARVVKMATETAQLLSTAVRIVAPGALRDDQLYRMGHEAHPVSRWVRSGDLTFQWTLQHGLALLDEYCVRFPKGSVHGASRAIHPILGVHLHAVLPHMTRQRPESVMFCNHAANLGMGLDFRSIENQAEAYREYLRARWHLARATRHPPRWTNRDMPEWAL